MALFSGASGWRNCSLMWRFFLLKQFSAIATQTHHSVLHSCSDTSTRCCTAWNADSGLSKYAALCTNPISYFVVFTGYLWFTVHTGQAAGSQWEVPRSQHYSALRPRGQPRWVWQETIQRLWVKTPRFNWMVLVSKSGKKPYTCNVLPMPTGRRELEPPRRTREHRTLIQITCRQYFTTHNTLSSVSWPTTVRFGGEGGRPWRGE